MIKPDNPLPPVLETFYAARDAVRVTRRIIPKQNAKNPDCQNELFRHQRNLLNRTVFPSDPAAQDLLDRTEIEIADLFVLNLWVLFERFVRSYLQEKGIALQKYVQPSEFGEALYKYFHEEVDSWNPKEVLDKLLKTGLFKTESGKQLIGSAKQILAYRNWIAHKNPKKEPSVKILPKTAYDTLNEIIETLLQNYS